MIQENATTSKKLDNQDLLDQLSQGLKKYNIPSEQQEVCHGLGMGEIVVRVGDTALKLTPFYHSSRYGVDSNFVYKKRGNPWYFSKDDYPNSVVSRIKWKYEQLKSVENTNCVNEKLASKTLSALKQAIPEATITSKDIISQTEPFTKHRVLIIQRGYYVYTIVPQVANICAGSNKKFYFCSEENLKHTATKYKETNKPLCCACTTLDSEDKFIKTLVSNVSWQTKLDSSVADRDNIIQLLYNDPEMQRQIVYEHDKQTEYAKYMMQMAKTQDLHAQKQLDRMRQQILWRKTSRRNQRQNQPFIQRPHTMESINNRRPPQHLNNNQLSNDIYH